MRFLSTVAKQPDLLVAPAIVFLITFVVGYLIRRLILRGLQVWVRRTQSRPGVILQESLSTPLWIWILILAVHFALQSSDLPEATTGKSATILADLFIASLTLMSMRIVRDVVRFYGAQIPGALPVTTLTQNLAQIAVLVLGVTVVLGPYFARLTPILTALGVGGLAVALALQDTLSNLFSGFYVAVAGQVRLGDYIKLNTGEEGYVTDISWRSTAIRALSNNMIIVPNAKLAQAIVTNFHLPEKRMSTSVQVNVSYGNDADRIERILMEIVTEGATNIPGLLAEPAPSVTFDPGMGDWAMSFSLNYHIAEFSNQYGVRHELRKRVLKRFQQEGIQIPFPTRTVHLDQGTSA